MFAEIATALLPTVAGLLGEGAAAGDRRTANEQAQIPLSVWQSLSVPDQEALKLHLQNYTSAGTLNPLQESLTTMGPSALTTVASDPRLVAQQQANLQQLQTIADTGGYDPTVRSALGEALRRQEQATQANQQALALQAQARGMQSSGATMALQQMANQSEANRTADIQDKLAAQAYQNRLNALSGASAEAGRLRTSDLSEQEMKAKAKDFIDQFNAQNKINVGERNINRGNRAQEENLTAAQRLIDNNTGLANEAEKARAQALKDIYEMQRGKNMGVSGAASTAATASNARANRTSGQITGAVSSIAQGGNDLSKYLGNSGTADTPTQKNPGTNSKGWYE